MKLNETIHGEVSSADASGGVAFTLYKPGTTTTRTIGATEKLVITDLAVISVPGGAVKVVADSDAGGLRVFMGTVPATGGAALNLTTPYVCPVGVTPKLFAPAGQVDAQLQGYIVKK